MCGSSHSSSGNLPLKEASTSSKLKWARLPTAPSIPTVAQSFGYEQGAYGKLVRHQPALVGHTGRGDDTSGPGEYDPLRGLKSVNKSRATDFSKGKVGAAMCGVVRFTLFLTLSYHMCVGYTDI